MKNRLLYWLPMVFVLLVSCKQVSRVSESEQLKIQLTDILGSHVNDADESISKRDKIFDYLKTVLESRSGGITQFNPQKGVYVFFTQREEKSVMIITNSGELPVELYPHPFSSHLESYEVGVDIATRHPYDVRFPIYIEGKSVLVLQLGHWL